MAVVVVSLVRLQLFSTSPRLPSYTQWETLDLDQLRESLVTDEQVRVRFSPCLCVQVCLV